MNSDINENLYTESDVKDTDKIGAEPPESEDKRPRPHKRLPLICKVLYAIAGLSALLYLLFLLFPPFADFFNKYISPIVRAPLALLTGWIPFSLAEYFILLIPLIIVILAGVGIKHYGATWRDVLTFLLIIGSIASYVFSTFTLGFVPAYRGSRLDVKMGLDKREVSAQELMDTALILSERISEETEGLVFDADGATVMPYSYEELNDKLMEAYGEVCKEYDFIQPLDSNFKRIMLSEPMTYTHISGVYTFFTGEANINVNFPDYTLPFTAAHEFAHQRGIAREDEANFVAFLVCAASDDQYIRYSAYINLFEYVANALYSADSQMYSKVYVTLPSEAKLEMAAYSKFFNKYRDSVASDVSETVNNTFLTVNGTEGTRSYGMVVDLAVAYYKAQSID